MRRGRCCCGCTISLRSIDLCSGLPHHFNFRIYEWIEHPGDGEDSTGDLIGEYETDAVTGRVVLDLEPGTYVIQVYHADYGWQSELITFECNEPTHWDVLGDDPVFAFRPEGCTAGAYLGGAKIEIVGPNSGVVISKHDAPVYFRPRGLGVYAITITHPSGRFETLTGEISVAGPCEGYYGLLDSILQPTADYSCCRLLPDDFGVRCLPISRILRATTSSGETWTFDVEIGDCGWSGPVDSDVLPIGGEAVEAMDDSAICSYQEFPDDLGTGKLSTYLDFDISNETARLWLPDTWPGGGVGITSRRILARFEPMTTANCMAQATGRLNDDCGTWWDAGASSNVGQPDVMVRLWYRTGSYVSGGSSAYYGFLADPSTWSKTVNSESPFSITFNFFEPLGASGWDGLWSDYICETMPVYPPVPLASVTIEEVV